MCIEKRGKGKEEREGKEEKVHSGENEIVRDLFFVCSCFFRTSILEPSLHFFTKRVLLVQSLTVSQESPEAFASSNDAHDRSREQDGRSGAAREPQR